MNSFKTRLEIMRDNLKCSEILIVQNYRLQSFFLMFPILEIIGKYTKKIYTDKTPKGDLFTYGFSTIFNKEINEETINQSFSIYSIIRNGLFHDAQLKDMSKNFPSNSEFFEKYKKDLKYIKVKLTDNETEFLNDEIILGTKDLHKKIEAYLSDSRIISDPFLNEPCVYMLIDNPAVSGTDKINSVNV